MPVYTIYAMGLEEVLPLLDDFERVGFTEFGNHFDTTSISIGGFKAAIPQSGEDCVEVAILLDRRTIGAEFHSM